MPKIIPFVELANKLGEVKTGKPQSFQPAMGQVTVSLTPDLKGLKIEETGDVINVRQMNDEQKRVYKDLLQQWYQKKDIIRRGIKIDKRSFGQRFIENLAKIPAPGRELIFTLQNPMSILLKKRPQRDKFWLLLEN